MGSAAAVQQALTARDRRRFPPFGLLVSAGPAVVTLLSPAQPAPRLRLSRSPPVQPQTGPYWLPCHLTLLAQLVRLHSVAMIVRFAVICSAGAATQACDEDDHSP
jgi:hypothetical protein